jgi:CubicO group peptidase (beta-lactamase class C family)
MKIKMKSIAFMLPVVLWANAVFSTDDFSAIDRYVNAAKKEIGVPTGTAIAIVKDGKIVYEASFGYANIKENKKVTNKTAFYIASITKPMFALSTLLMEYKGDIKDSTSMAKMFPKQVFPHIDAEKIQLKHLMSNTSGIENWMLVDTLAFTGNHNNDQRHKLMVDSTYNEKNKLGQYEYTNLGFNIVSIWAENYYQQDWQQTIAELIYEPLGMTHTSSYMSDASKKGFEVARPYSLSSIDPREVYPFEKSNVTMHGAGGTIATVSDMARFLIAQLNEGKVEGKQVFPADVIKKSHQQLAVNDLKYRDFVRNGYAWGWYMGSYKDENMYHHFGGVAGTHTHSSYMLEHNIGLVVLNNESHMSSKLTNAIADIAYSVLLDKGNAEEKADLHITEMKNTWVKVEVNIKESLAKTKKVNAERVMVLSETKSKYTGMFHNNLWGGLTVELLGSNEFKFTLGELVTVATAYTKTDTMRIEFPAMGGGKVVTFDITNGKIQGLKLLGEYFNKA